MLVDEIAKNMQMEKQTDLILLDFSKAFDKVAPEKLISKLHFYGIRGKTLSWVKDFWDSRSQAVVLNGVKSDKIAVSSGVPQVSVLGPILFLAYINDLPDQVKSRVRLFADDTAIYLAISSEGESITLQNDLHDPRHIRKTMGHGLQPVQMPGPTYYKSQMSHPDQIHTSRHCLRTSPLRQKSGRYNLR